MLKSIILNTLPLTKKKSYILENVFQEYLKVLNLILNELKNAKSSLNLHHLSYYKIRQLSFLPSDLIQEARKDVWAHRKTIGRHFRNCSIRLNKRWFRLIKSKLGNPCFKITYSPRKNFVIPIKVDGQFQRLESFIKEGWNFENILLLKNGRINIILEKEFEKPPLNQDYVIGIDIGSRTLATATIFSIKDSKVVKQLYFGRDIGKKQENYFRRRKNLQSLADKGSSYAKKSLEKLKHKQFNFVKTRSGQIAKEIINLAKKYNAFISIEKLNLKEKRGKFCKKTNRKISHIPYGRFKEFLKANSNLFGIPLVEVDPYHTSKWCSCCGAVNKGHKGNNYALYSCKNCGLTVNSDRKASLAIAIKSVLERNFIKREEKFQISKTQVPIGGLLRPKEVGLNKVFVKSSNLQMESFQKS